MKTSIPLGFIGGGSRNRRKIGVNEIESERVVLLFNKGSAVEVSSTDNDNNNNHGFKGDACSWFEATILDLPTPTASSKRGAPKRSAFLVKYHTLFAAGSKPLKQYVQPSCVRPLPPLIEPGDSFFEPNGIVDAFCGDGGWRTGVITNAADENNSKFSVLFQNPAEEVEFDRKNLRVHQDWVDGKWVLPEKKGTKQQKYIASTDQEMVESAQITASGKNGSAEELPVPIIGGLKSTVMKGAEANDSCQLRNVELLKLWSDPNDPEKCKTMEIKHRGVGMQTLKKRLARPRKFESIVPASGEEHLGAGDKANATVVQDSAGLSRGGTFTQGNESWESQEEAVRHSHEYDAVNESVLVENQNFTFTQVNESWESQEEAVRHSHEYDAVNESVLVENQNLPFVKNLPLIWKAIESMEVFQRMPQNPHFHSLRNDNECLREGLAISQMAIFATLAERAFKLHFDEPKSTIERRLEILTELEMNGFDVKVVRGQLHKLLLIKEQERQIVEHAREKSKLEEELNEIKKKMIDLQEKHAMAKSMEAKAIERMRSLQLEFEEIAAAPF